MLEVTLNGDSLKFGERFSITFQRTLRIPDDGKNYPLPPGLGPFPIRRVEDYKKKVPKSWRKRGGFFIPMYQREALWISFNAAYWKPNAVKVGVGEVNAITGEEWDEKLHADPQDYMVAPNQPWLDGIKSGEGFIRQFVAMPLGQGYTVEAQITGKEDTGGIQLIAFEPKPGRFPDEPPAPVYRTGAAGGSPMFAMAAAPAPAAAAAPAQEMGLGAGGKMVQKVYPDSYGIETWDQENFGSAFIHIVNSEQFAQITGEPAPPTPISAQTYTSYGFPWFALYDEAKQDLTPTDKIAGVKSVREKDEEKRKPSDPEDQSVAVTDSQVKKLWNKLTGHETSGRKG